MPDTLLFRGRPLNQSVIAIVWMSVSSVLWMSSAAKAANFAVFASYLTSVFPISTPFAIAGAALLIAVEAAVPLIALLNPGLRMAACSAAALYAGFTLFHGMRLLVGDPLPCDCFGSLVNLSTGAYLAIDSLCLAGALAVFKSTERRKSDFDDRPTWRMLQIASCFLAASIVLGVIRGQQRPVTGQSLQLDFDASLFLSEERILHQGSLSRASLVLFGDYSCPYCRRLLDSEAFRKLLLRDDVSVYWREEPLESLHPRAKVLAVLSQVSRARNSWSNFMLIESKNLDAIELKDLLRTGLSPQPTDLEVDSAIRCVAEDQVLAKSHRLARTPVLFAVTRRGSFLISDLSALDTVL